MAQLFPVLTMDGIRVLPFERRHLTQRYVSWLNDQVVVQFSEQRHHHHTLITCTDYFESMQKTENYFLAIEAYGNNLGHIGNIGVVVDRHNRVADMSIIIGEKQAWGTGSASIAWIAVLTEMLKNQNMRKITAGTMAVNEPMLRLMRRSDMHTEAVRRGHFLLNDNEIDLVQAAKFKERSFSSKKFAG